MLMILYIVDRYMFPAPKPEIKLGSQRLYNYAEINDCNPDSTARPHSQNVGLIDCS